MNSYLNNSLKSKLKGLGYYQIICGIIGILLTIWMLAQMGELTGMLLLLFFTACALYGFSIYCGQQVLKANTQKALRLSFANQFLQVFSMGIRGYAYFYVAGPAIAIGVNLTDGLKLIFNIQLLPAFQFTWNSDETTFKIAINLIAIGAIYYIEQLSKEVKTSEQLFISSTKIAEELSKQQKA